MPSGVVDGIADRPRDALTVVVQPALGALALNSLQDATAIRSRKTQWLTERADQNLFANGS